MDELLSFIIRSVFSENGVIGVLFAMLLTWVMKENKEREQCYRDTIDKNQEVILEQAKNFDIVKEIREDVNDLKEVIIVASRKQNN